MKGTFRGYLQTVFAQRIKILIICGVNARADADKHEILMSNDAATAFIFTVTGIKTAIITIRADHE